METLNFRRRSKTVSEFNYRLTVLTTPDDETAVDPEALPQGGYAFVALPFEGDEETLLAVALEQVGVFDSTGFSIEGDATGGFIIRDDEEEPVLALELEVEDEDEPGADLYRPFGAYDGDVGLALDEVFEEAA